MTVLSCQSTEDSSFSRVCPGCVSEVAIKSLFCPKTSKGKIKRVKTI